MQTLTCIEVCGPILGSYHWKVCVGDSKAYSFWQLSTFKDAADEARDVAEIMLKQQEKISGNL